MVNLPIKWADAAKQNYNLRNQKHIDSSFLEERITKHQMFTIKVTIPNSERAEAKNEQGTTTPLTTMTTAPETKA